MAAKKIIGIGEVLYDVLPEGAKLGGAPANFAFHVNQFGFESLAISAVGADKLGDKALETFDSVGLKYIIPRVGYPTGTVNVSLDAKGVPTYSFTPDVAWDYIPLSATILEAAADCRAVCFGTLAQRSKESRKTILGFLDATPEECVKIYDINLRLHFYSKEIITESLDRADILKINDEELDIVAPMFGIEATDIEARCRAIATKFSLKMVILTCGTQGSYVFAEGESSFMPTPKVKVADTVGAGDSFTGAFTASTLSGKSVREAHELAVKVSAFVCTKAGAMPKIPDSLKEGIGVNS